MDFPLAFDGEVGAFDLRPNGRVGQNAMPCNLASIHQIWGPASAGAFPPGETRRVSTPSGARRPRGSMFYVYAGFRRGGE